jgi:UPF0271 protein
MIVEPLGDGALRLRIPDDADPRAVLRALRATPGVIDCVITERHACVRFDDLPPALPNLSALPPTPGPAPARHVIHVRYDGADLSGLGLSASEVIALHAHRDYTVRLIGFLPGFAYLGDVDERLRRPRLATPRPRVPAGSVAIAERYTGVYPFASAGGWRLIGTAIDYHPFAAEIGDVVRFEPA